MAPESNPQYFPPLDQCLIGEKILLSWRSAFAVVSELLELNARRNDTDIVALTEDLEKVRGFLATTKIASYLSEIRTAELIQKPWAAFPTPDADSKRAFDTKTAAINVAQNANAKYDLAEMKEDALHLSRSMKIDELSALRIVVQEFQSRARAELLLGMREEEVASLSNIISSSSNLSMAAEILALAKSDEEYKFFSSQEGRRDRILRTYLSEREYLMKTTGLLYQRSLHQHRIRKQGGAEQSENDVISLLGSFVNTTAIDQDQDVFLLGFLNALGSIIDELYKDNQGESEQAMGIEYARSMMTEAVCYMEIIFQILDSLVEIPSSQVILRWFQIFAPYNFLDEFPLQYNHMKSLISVISLTMLRLRNSIKVLQESSNVLTSGSTDKPAPYVLDDDAIFAIHTIIFDCAQKKLVITSPSVLAWSIYLITIQETLEEDSDDGFESDSSGTEQGDSSLPGSRHQQSSGKELPPQAVRYGEILTRIKNSSIEDDPIAFMANKAVCSIDEDTVDSGDSLLFDFLIQLGLQISKYDRDGPSGVLGSRMRAAIVDFLSLAVPKLVYSTAIVDASLAVITGGQNYWDLVETPELADDEDSFLRFLEDPILMDHLFEISANRQPYERKPFLKFALALAACHTPDSDRNPAGGSILDDRRSFTHTLSKEFRDFEAKQEEDNANLIALTRPIEIFGHRRVPKFLAITDGSRDYSADQFTIAAGTNGRLVSETEPRVAVWFHSYSGYAYLGKLLETSLNNSATIEALGEPVDDESICDIIEIFATLLLSCKKLKHPQQAAQHILERASEGLSRTHDIINVIFSLFEKDLDYRSVNPGHNNFLGISISSVHFIHALMYFMPGRVWPFLARSRLLDADGRGSKLNEIVAGTEIVKGHFGFLLSCIRLFDSLVEDAVSQVVSRKGTANASLVRYGSLQDLGSGLPNQGLIRVIDQFTGVLIDVFNSVHSWRHHSAAEYSQLLELIARTLCNIISYEYGVDGPQEPKSKVASPLAQAARHIVDSFLSTYPGNLPVQVILHTFVDGHVVNDVEFEPALLTLYRSRVAATFRLTITLIKLRSMLELPPSQLEIQLFSAVALLVRLYAAHESYKPLVLTLLKELVVGATNHDGEPPSLIGHLRPETTKSFLTLLSDLDRPYESDNQVTLIWQFFSAVVSNRQRTLAIILLTGKTPRQALKDSDSSPLLEKPFLSIALDILSTLNFDTARSKLDPSPPAIAILEFVSQSQDFWPLQTGKLQSHPNFVQSISNWVEELAELAEQTLPAFNRADEQQLLQWCYSLRMASLIAEILAMYLFRCREMGNMAPVKEIIRRLQFFKRYAVGVPNYNSSLHGNLQRNFEARYGGLSPLAFKRTRLGKRTLGANYFYDIVLSYKMLKFDQAWEGRRGDGLCAEFIRANINLSIVDAQIALLHGWKFLAIELRNSVPQEPDLQRLFARITTECLVSNKQEQPPEHIFDRLMQTRTDFALMAMQTLLDTQAKKQLAVGAAPAVKHVLERVWETVQYLRETLDLALSAGDGQYYRSLLKLLYLALQAHAPQTDDASNANAGNSTAMKPSVSREILIALEVTNHVVARGFRELVVAIHDKASESSPEDIFLLTNILAACLRIPNIGFCHDQIINHMINNEAARVAVTLFSWSDRLAINGDPIYGELSIGFLLELSSMKAMAEQIAVDGILGQIGSAGLTNYLRRGNVSPFAEGVGPQRCYDIWVRGILPLLLNLLYSIGSLIGAEVAIFLNQFTPLLQNSLKGLEPNEANRTMSGIVLKPVISRVVSEINTLALIHHILKDYRFSLAGISEIPEVPGLAALDGTAVLESAEFWLDSRQLLRERIMPMGQKELELSKQKALRKDNACENRLEERIVEELMGIRDILTPAVNGDA